MSRKLRLSRPYLLAANAAQTTPSIWPRTTATCVSLLKPRNRMVTSQGEDRQGQDILRKQVRRPRPPDRPPRLRPVWADGARNQNRRTTESRPERLRSSNGSADAPFCVDALFRGNYLARYRYLSTSCFTVFD